MQTIYLDTCLVIYLVEKHEHFYEPLVKKISNLEQTRFVVSSLTELEVMVKPEKDRNHHLIELYREFLDIFQIEGLTDSIVKNALRYRVSGLKTPDALHVAFAKYHQCDLFWTNDDRLAKVLPDWTINIFDNRTSR